MDIFCIAIQLLALSAFMEQPSYSVDEANENLEVCVVLQGALETSLSLVLNTMDISATGTGSFS